MSEKSLRIKALRMQKGLKSKQMAEILGVSPAYLSQIENGVRPPSDEIVKKLCDYTGASVNFINNGDVDASSNNGHVIIQSPGAQVEPIPDKEPQWAISLNERINKLEDQLSDIQALLVKLVAKG